MNYRLKRGPIAPRHLESGKPTREHIHTVIRTPNGNDYDKNSSITREHPHPHEH